MSETTRPDDPPTPEDGDPRPPPKKKALPELDYEVIFPDDARRRTEAARTESEPPAPEPDPAQLRRPDVRPAPIVVRREEAAPPARRKPSEDELLAPPARGAAEPPRAQEDASAASEAAPADFERPGSLVSRYDAHLIMYHDPRGLQAEQYRTCRTNLAALNRSGAPWAVVVTSSKAGEGKSVTAANLAVCLAELPGSRVCLLDTDFRAPTQGTIFGLPSGPGLSELLGGEISWADAVRPSRIRDLDLMLSGAEPPSPAELLGSDRFVNLVHELKRRYSWIVLDTPPVHPFTDACVVSSVTNGALLVVRLQETSRELVNRTIDSITTAGGRVLGSFLTGVPPDRDEAERQDYYRVEGEGDGGPRELKRDGMERKLRRQERAWLKQRRKRERGGEETV